MKLLISISILFYLLLLSCSDNVFNSENHYFSLGDTLFLNFQETLTNNDENISITFNKLISDGRCPLDLRCFWEGDAEVEFLISQNNLEEYFSLHTAHTFSKRDTIFFGYSIKLIELQPYPHSKISYKSNDYTVELVIE